ncbi:MAG: thioredoxin domain-containing protein [Firmicutes bacterium]|nr:thioredoxin domain-containing protein [Bacillota bacterium]
MANRLAGEKSPYLLQHKDNPVDWYPWGEEAFARARSEERPIFLSIGYSTCHWCHVMERESFEDEEVAKLLNDNFVAVKVDREERPDVDHIYMTVCQALTGSGGWPLTVLMTPDKKPFFAGTYFPKHGRYNLPGLVDILEQVAEKWRTGRKEMLEAAERIAEGVRPHFKARPGGNLTEEVLDKAYRQLAGDFDPDYGGFGRAPKFPSPHNLTFLLRHWKRGGGEKALSMVEKTLDAMYRGGIYDHVGFGFARYSTDREWLVPHFEKMLYDNALLAITFLETYQATGKEGYARVAGEIFTYVLRDMTGPEGGFYSAEDADSEGEEGKFYLWSPEGVKAVLGRADGEAWCRLYDITPGGNFEGMSIPNLIKSGPGWGLLTEEKGGGAGSVPARAEVERWRQKLFEAREKRVHPHKDDKILTAWNGLMIAALAKGAAVLGDARYAGAAGRAADFVLQALRRPDGRLLARYRDGEAAYPAYLDDYAFLTWGLIELYGATFEAKRLREALNLAEQAVSLFWDRDNGGFFFSGEDAEELLARPKEVYDGALPSGNSVMLLNLLRLARLSGSSRLEELANRQLAAFAGDVARQPRAYTHFLMGLQFALGPAREIVVAGRAGDRALQDMVGALRRMFLPEAVVAFHPEGEGQREIQELAPHLKENRAAGGNATAYVCQGYACLEPVTDVEKLKRVLQQ